jgi:hypothetical protein
VGDNNCTRVVWEVVPGDIEKIFREITSEDFDPCLFSSSPPARTQSLPATYPLLNPAVGCLDRVWAQTIIRINYQASERPGKHGT